MEDFVPFEIAKKLKEKGFKEKCLAYYDIDDNVGLLHNTQYGDEYSPYQYTDLLQSHNTDTTVVQPDDSENCCDAPTISQVLKWLREEKKIHIQVLFACPPNRWEYITIRTTNCEIRGMQASFISYELAAIAGIKYCLDNLI